MLHGSISILHILLIIVLALQIKTLELSQQDERKSQGEKAHQQQSNQQPLDRIKNFHYSCSNAENCGILKKIEYFPCSLETNSCNININLNSACIRCEICLTIVDQINQTLTYVHKKFLNIKYLNDGQVESLFKSICEHAFTNYGLRNIDGNRMIHDRTSEANLIVTNVDDEWESHLKGRCYDLTEEMGPIKLYKYWKHWWDNKSNKKECTKLETVLCRGESIYFRDCRSMAQTNRPASKSIGNTRFRGELKDTFSRI